MGYKARSKKNDVKTRPTRVSPETFIAGLSDERRRREAETLLKLLGEVSGQPPVMWGSSIVGYGSYHYKYSSGREGDWCRLAFSPRKQNVTVYLMPGFDEQQDLLSQLGPHKTAVSCLYIRKLETVDLSVLRKIAQRSWDQMAERYPE